MSCVCPYKNNDIEEFDEDHVHVRCYSRITYHLSLSGVPRFASASIFASSSWNLDCTNTCRAEVSDALGGAKGSVPPSSAPISMSSSFCASLLLWRWTERKMKTFFDRCMSPTSAASTRAGTCDTVSTDSVDTAWQGVQDSVSQGWTLLFMPRDCAVFSSFMTPIANAIRDLSVASVNAVSNVFVSIAMSRLIIRITERISQP